MQNPAKSLSLGSAPGGRRFESFRPDQLSISKSLNCGGWRLRAFSRRFACAPDFVPTLDLGERGPPRW